MASMNGAPGDRAPRDPSRDTYLLRDGRVCASARPLCFERMGPVEGRDAAGGLWAVVADDAGDNAEAEPQRWRVVAWLSPTPGPTGAAPQRWHDFRAAVLARYPRAGFRAYPRTGAAGAMPPSAAHASSRSGQEYDSA
jgi:hypothetical protein